MVEFRQDSSSVLPAAEGDSSRKARIGRAAGVLAALAVAALCACGGPPAKAANPTRALAERRAVEVIIGAFRNERDQPGAPRQVKLPDGQMLEVDVTSHGRKYGVAYVTAQERQQLGASLPPRDASMGDALQLVSGGGEDSDARILVLNADSYRYDDHVGTSHESTTITAERRLARDVHDFLVRAHSERWP